MQHFLPGLESSLSTKDFPSERHAYSHGGEGGEDSSTLGSDFEISEIGTHL